MKIREHCDTCTHAGVIFKYSLPKGVKKQLLEKCRKTDTRVKLLELKKNLLKLLNVVDSELAKSGDEPLPLAATFALMSK